MSIEVPKVVDGHIVSNALTFKSCATPYTLTPLQLPVASQDVITKPTQVLIKTEAVAFNHIDVLLKELNPQFLNSVKVAGTDFAGTVLQIGSEVEDINFKVGDRVSGCIMLPMSQKMAFQEYILRDIEDFIAITKVPAGLSLEQAAGLSVVANTAYTGFAHGPKGIKGIKGANVLVLGAGSAVGIMAVKFSKYFSAKFVAATASQRSTELAKASGAQETIDYTKGATSEINQVLELVKNYGKFDFIFDAVRDENIISNLAHILKTKKEGGKICIVGGVFGLEPKKPTYRSMIPSFKFFRVLFSSAIGLSSFDIDMFVMEKNKGYPDSIQALGKEGALNISIDSVYNFYTQYEEAYQQAVFNKAKGKVILVLEESRRVNE